MSSYSTETISRQTAIAMIMKKLSNDLMNLNSLTNDQLANKIMEVEANDFLKNYEVIDD